MVGIYDMSMRLGFVLLAVEICYHETIRVAEQISRG